MEQIAEKIALIIRNEGNLSDKELKEVKDAMLELLKKIGRKRRKVRIVKSSHYELTLKPDYLNMIMKVKGWKSQAEMAADMGFTRAYVSKVKRGGKVTTDFMSRLAVELGSLNGGWWEPFMWVEKGPRNPDSKAFNMDKYEGRHPYSDVSEAAIYRKIDGPVEQRKSKYTLDKQYQ